MTCVALDTIKLVHTAAGGSELNPHLSLTKALGNQCGFLSEDPNLALGIVKVKMTKKTHRNWEL